MTTDRRSAVAEWPNRLPPERSARASTAARDALAWRAAALGGPLGSSARRRQPCHTFLSTARTVSASQLCSTWMKTGSMA